MNLIVCPKTNSRAIRANELVNLYGCLHFANFNTLILGNSRLEGTIISTGISVFVAHGFLVIALHCAVIPIGESYVISTKAIFQPHFHV